jgi:hypothetical protein
VLVADDSKEARSLKLHRRLAVRFGQGGLQCHYFGPDEQLALLARIPEEERALLEGVLGQQQVEAFFHKGASITRNLAYLQIRRLLFRAPETLIHFIDSDQEFRIGLPGRQPYGISYFHHLERIFRLTDALVVTGKVVGDPPVSPAVMAGNLLADVRALLRELASVDPTAACRFHQGGPAGASEAAYHDMADLFGFRSANEARRYACPLQGKHDHRACLSDFVERLPRFFDGEHPTRKSYYHYSDPLKGLQSARTLYTGNYVLRSAALRYFIPFAPLRLRMAGPVLGRILQAELGRRFTSANLPLLHKRTQGESGRCEFRPGIERQAQQVDLSGEFGRQYYGDVMLFSMERLTAAGYPLRDCSSDWVRQILVEVEAELYQRYQQRRLWLGDGLHRLQQWLQEGAPWWEHETNMEAVPATLYRFIANLRHNFLTTQLERDPARLSPLLEAILRYPAERQLWESLLARGLSAP